MSRLLPIALALAGLLLLALWWVQAPGAGSRAPTRGPADGEAGSARVFTRRVVEVEQEQAPGVSVSEPTAELTPTGELDWSRETWLPRADLGHAAPPGLVRIQAGRYPVGLDAELAEELIESSGLRPIAAETPMHRVDLREFWIMPTEVTGAQYLRFVQATGARPPLTWGQAAVDAAELAHATEQGQARQLARDAGLPAPRPQPFDPAAWWRSNWETCDWQLTPEQSPLPVRHVDHHQAQAYARWAGLRLVSEAEFQAAGRGATERAYPWGDEPGPDLANGLGARRSGVAVPGSFLLGSARVDAEGHLLAPDQPVDAQRAEGLRRIHDLSGNVWEWTRDRFRAYPGFTPLQVALDRRSELLSPAFGGEQFTAVGGAFDSPDLALRLTTRRGTDPDQTTAALGLRCTGSAVPGLALAEELLESDLRRVPLPIEALDLEQLRRGLGRRYTTVGLLALDRFHAESYRTGLELEHAITGYDHLLVGTVENTWCEDLDQLRATAAEVPVPIGYLSTSVPLLEPPLAPGTYWLAWRAEPDRPSVLRFTSAREEVLEWPCEPRQVPDLQGRAEFQTGLEAERAAFDLVVPAQWQGRGFEFPLRLVFEDPAGEPWRCTARP